MLCNDQGFGGPLVGVQLLIVGSRVGLRFRERVLRPTTISYTLRGCCVGRVETAGAVMGWEGSVMKVESALSPMPAPGVVGSVVGDGRG